MMPDEWIPYLLHRLGVKKDSLLESIIMISLFPLMIIIIWQFFNFDEFIT